MKIINTDRHKKKNTFFGLWGNGKNTMCPLIHLFVEVMEIKLFEWQGYGEVTGC